MIITDLFESRRLHVGDPIIVIGPNEYEGKTGEITELGRNGAFVVVQMYNGETVSMHSSDVEYNEYADEQDADEFWDEEEVDEGWSDAMVARRTGQPRTPYSVYIKGKKWKDFENDDHAEAVANKLRAKFKAEGRDPSVITVAPTDYDKDMKEAISKKDLLKQVGDKLNNPEFKKTPADPTKSFTRGDHWKGAGPGDYGYTGYQGHGMPTDRAEQARIRADKKKGMAEDQWDSGEDVTVTQDDQSTTYQYKGNKFVVSGEEAQGEAWWYEPGDTWREAEHYNYVYDESKGIDRFYNEDGQNVFNLSTTNQSKVEQFVKAKAKDFVSTMAAQPNLPSMNEQGVVEGSRGSAIQQGQRDYARGLSKQQNPYFKSDNGKTPPAAYDWEAGWDYARDAGKKQGVEEEWSKKYKDSINCSNPKGFSQKAHCDSKKKNEDTIEKMLDENLRKWFKDKWVRFGPDGKIRGDCARGSESEGKPKCLPQAKAQALGKKGRASAAAKKRREDPNPERRGKAKNVATKVKEEQLDEKCWDGYKKQGMKKKGDRMVPNCVPKESIEEAQTCPDCGGPMYNETVMMEKKDACYYKVKASAKIWPSAYASGRLVQCRKKGAKNYGNKKESVAEGGVDDLEARRIDDLNMRMLDLLDRAKEPAYKKNPAALAGLKKQFQKIKAERDSYFKINPATGMNADQTLGTVKGALDESDSYYKIRESKKKEISLKSRDPNYLTLTAKRTSGASGSHANKKRDQQQGKLKHKAQELDLAEAAKAKTVAKLAPAIKLFQATIRVKMPDYTGLMDVNVTAQNINMARQMVKAMYNIQNSNVVNVKEVKALREGSSCDDVKIEGKSVLENTKDKDELNPGEYYIWRVYFDDGSSKRIKVTSSDFDPYKYYAKKNQNVINVDFNWEKHK